MRFRVLSLLAIVLATAAIASCSEEIQGGASCPLLCPQQDTPLRDTVLEAITLDTSLAGFPPLGFESTLLLSKQGDSIDAGIVTRYDSMPTHFAVNGVDSAFTHVDSAFIQGLRLAADADTTLKLKDDATVEVYDVTNAIPDTATASLLAEMTPANRIGTRALAKGDNPDTLKVLLDTARVRARMIDDKRLRIALRMVTPTSAQLRFLSRNEGGGFTLVVYPSRDTTTEIFKIPAVTDTAGAAIPIVNSALADFPVVITKPLAHPNMLRAGGYPTRRVLLRFKLPPSIVDSSSVIRATLFLTQGPSTAPTSGDTTYLYATPIIASSLVTDVHLALEFAAAPLIFPPDSSRFVPSDSGKKEIDIVRIIRAWRGQDTLKTPRAIALLMDNAGKANAIDFFSAEAPAGVRPQLRITYASKPSSGRP